jgi:hypothetical protein
MDWGAIGKQIASKGADLLGEAIPIPGTDFALDLVADALGTSKDPDEISKAIEQDPEAALKLRKAELNNETELRRIKAQRQSDREQTLTERMSEVNETVRTGYREGVYWRRAVGWTFIACSLMVVIRVVIMPPVFVAFDKADALNQAPVHVNLLKWVFSCFLAILGVSSWHEGLLGRTMGGEQGGKVTKAIKALRGKD